VTRPDERKMRTTLNGFYQFLCGEMTLFEFGSWLHEHNDVEEIIGKTGYNDLLSGDFYDDSVEINNQLRRRLVEIHQQCGPALLEKEMGRRLLCTFLSGKLDAINFVEEMNYLLQRGQDWIPVYFVGLLSEMDNNRLLPTEPAKLQTVANELLSEYFPGEDCSSATSPMPYLNYLHNEDSRVRLQRKQMWIPPKGPQKPPRELPRQNPRVPFYDEYMQELKNNPRAYGVEAEAIVVDCGSTRKGLPEWEDSDMAFHFWTYEYEYRDPNTGETQKYQDTLIFTASIWGTWFTKYNVGFRFQVRYHKRVPSVHILLHNFD
jgi:hypothetical protein